MRWKTHAIGLSTTWTRHGAEAEVVMIDQRARPGRKDRSSRASVHQTEVTSEGHDHGARGEGRGR